MEDEGRATLTVIDKTTRAEGASLVVHFNPQTLRLHYQTLGAVGTQTSGHAVAQLCQTLQRTGPTSTLAIELLFDTSTTGEDVRNTTYQIVEMITPPKKDKNGNPDVPWVRFHWGTFVFLGTVQSMDETIDLFSADGKPLRSTVTFTMAQVEPPAPESDGGGLGGAGASAGLGFSAGLSAGIGLSAGLSAGVSVGAAVGTTPLTLAQAGDSLQSLAARAGIGASWKAVAAANGIDNPRLLDAGAVIDLNARASASASASLG